MSLFGRSVVVEIGEEGGTGRRHTGLRVAFRVEMDQSSNPHTATIQVYNLRKGAETPLNERTGLVRLLVGYGTLDGTPPTPRLIFQGNPVVGGVRVEKRATDRVTLVDAQDGGRAYQSARVSLSIATPTTALAVFREVATLAGYPTGQITAATDVTYPHGGAWYGPARDVLATLADTMGSRVWVSDGVLFLVPPDASLASPVPLFSAARGNLVGSPTPKDGGRIEVTGLLDASVRPGRTISVESEQYTGQYVAEKVTFEGDSGYSAPFYVKAVARRA